MKKNLLLFRLLPFRLRHLWRSVLRFFGYTTLESTLDDYHDAFTMLKIQIGVNVAEPLQEYLNEK